MTDPALHAGRPAALLVVLLTACAALLAACAAPGHRPASLMEAYAAVDAARSDRKVRALAPAGSARPRRRSPRLSVPGRRASRSAR